jgi:hypothetical protein
MTHKRLMFAHSVYQGIPDPDFIKDGDTITMSNLAQMEKDTPFLEKLQDLIFEDCNLTNVRIQDSWKVGEDCNIASNDYDPTEIFPDEAAIAEKTKRETIIQDCIDSFAVDIRAASKDVATDDLSVDAIKEAISIKKPIEPIKRIGP